MVKNRGGSRPKQKKMGMRFVPGDREWMRRILKVVELPREGLLPNKFFSISKEVVISIDGTDTPIRNIEALQAYLNLTTPEKLVPENSGSIMNDFIIMIRLIVSCYEYDDMMEIYLGAATKAGLRENEAARIMIASIDKIKADDAAKKS